MKHVVLFIGIVGLLSLVEGTPFHCAEYLQCEAELMTLHRKCSDRSRNITSEACHLLEEFRELRGLMSMRETEFAICVGHESVREVELGTKKPTSKCNVTVAEPTVIHGCWRSVAVIKRRCQRLKSCCPAAEKCIRRLASSDTTALVRRKHVDINLKTLKCLNDMETIIRVHRNDETNPLVNRAHAVFIARGEALMDVVGQDQFLGAELKSSDPFFPQKKNVRTRAKHVTSILKSRYTELARIAEELSSILVQKRQRRRQKELLKKYGSGFSSGKRKKMLLKKAKLEPEQLTLIQKRPEELEPFSTQATSTTVLPTPIIMSKKKFERSETEVLEHASSTVIPTTATILLSSVGQADHEVLEALTTPPTSISAFPTMSKMKFGKKIKYATVTSSGEDHDVTTPLATTTVTPTVPTTTTEEKINITKVPSKYGRSRESYWPDFVIDNHTRTTIAPSKPRTDFRRKPTVKKSGTDAPTTPKEQHPISKEELALAVLLPNLPKKKISEAKSVEMVSPRIPQEYTQRNKVNTGAPLAKLPKGKNPHHKTEDLLRQNSTSKASEEHPTTTKSRPAQAPRSKIPIMPDDTTDTSSKSPAELQNYLKRNKGEVPKRTSTTKTTTQAEAYVGNDGTWTMDPPKSEEAQQGKDFTGSTNELITHEEGTFPVSPYHRELMGDKSANEIRRSGKHGLTMATAEPLFVSSAERSSKDRYGDHAVPHIVEKEIVESATSGRIPFNLLDNSLQDRIGIFPITTKEPRRIKITMWPPGYRNHFTHRLEAHGTTEIPPRVAAAGSVLTSRMPESFYKVFYPQLKPAKRHRLKGYRNKVLFARRHLKRPKGRVAYNYANAVTHHVEDVPPTAVTKLPIHRLRPKEYDNGINQITDEGVYESNDTSSEETSIDDLKFRLMIELETYLQTQHGKHRQEMESELQHERVALLRRPRVEYDHLKRRIGYCELYAACTDELKSVQNRCKHNNSRLMPGLPKRRFGDCAGELVPEFQKYDQLVREAENAFDNCFVDELANETTDGTTFESDTCHPDWPLLPEYESRSTCHEKVRIIQHHCGKLGSCCTSVNKCHAKVENMTLTEQVAEMKASIATKSADCQIKNFETYKSARMNEQKPSKEELYEDVITEEDLSFYLSDQPDGRHKLTDDSDDNPERVTTHRPLSSTPF
ncbi:hypothetical protein QR680_000695 [Steinernema hermaphroditum]|uniref:Uncharacterized protein n=1 Tax=Steinernema hermaphroditum TaxID=289476 RepID=A0AA39GVP3_9BILA|nr:hypothetical protein QR680_000695 [Steinernema hermaphroditum]